MQTYHILSHRVQGRGHVKEKIPCQDATYQKQEDNTHIIVLADGAGSARFSHYGSEATSKYVANMLYDGFDRFYESDDLIGVQKEFINGICNNLEILKDEVNKDKQGVKDFKEDLKQLVDVLCEKIESHNLPKSLDVEIGKLRDFYKHKRVDLITHNNALKEVESILLNILDSVSGYAMSDSDKQLMQEKTITQPPKKNKDSKKADKEDKSFIEKGCDFVKNLFNSVKGIKEYGQYNKALQPQMPKEDLLNTHKEKREKYIKEIQSLNIKSSNDESSLKTQIDTLKNKANEFHSKLKELIEDYKLLYKDRFKTQREPDRIEKKTMLCKLGAENLAFDDFKGVFNQYLQDYNMLRDSTSHLEKKLKDDLEAKKAELEKLDSEYKNSALSIDSLKSAAERFKMELDSIEFNMPLSTNPLSKYINTSKDFKENFTDRARDSLLSLLKDISSFNDKQKAHKSKADNIARFYDKESFSDKPKLMFNIDIKEIDFSEDLEHFENLVSEIDSCICVNIRDLASTLLFAAIKDSKFILGHLGDGISGFLSGDEIKVANHPDGEGNATYFVTSKGAETRLRLIKGEMKNDDREIHGFVLMSDGSGESFYQNSTKSLVPLLAKYMNKARSDKENTQKELEKLMEERVREKTIDDCSIAIIVEAKK